MAYDVEQDRSVTNLIIKGLKKAENSKTYIAQVLLTKTEYKHIRR